LNQVLAIRQEIGDRRGEGDTLNNLGIATRDRGDPARSLAFFRQALELRRKIGDQVGEGSSLHNMGWAVYASGDLPQAQALLQQALALRETLNQPRLTVESQAALAQVALAKGDLPQARDRLSPVLVHLKKNPALDGTQNPFQMFLTCYHVLKAAGDSHAGDVLQTAHTLLMEQAAKIVDETRRRSFLENVAMHREILSEPVIRNS